MKRKVMIGGLVLLLGAATCELVCWFIIGLGDPPLYVAHPVIEYMLKPNASYKRFGNVFRTNRYGMRSDEMPVSKATREVRILVLGDSIPNGGAPTDQAELATEIVKRGLGDRLHRPVVVGNISAGTWSPHNLLAYIETYGTFDADLALIVLNRDDLDDVPAFGPLHPSRHPTRKPISATSELVLRYLLPRVAGVVGGSAADPARDQAASRASCIAALDALIARLRADGCRVRLFYHPFRHEIGADGAFHPDEPFEVLRGIARHRDVPFISLAAGYGSALREGRSLYRDGQHLNAAGQAVMAEEMLWVLASER